jgi:hypothetical protein
MTQAQAQQIPQYTEQYRQFDELVRRLDEGYAAIAWGLCSTSGLQVAIDFCISKLESVDTMQACRDFEKNNF